MEAECTELLKAFFALRRDAAKNKED
jgi:hypothetical protein